MNNDSKRVKNVSHELNFALKYKIKIPAQTLNDLYAGLKNGFRNDCLALYFQVKRTLSSNRDINDGMVSALCEWFLKLEGKIKKLRLDWNCMTSTGGSMIFNHLRESKSIIEDLDLSQNEIDDECCESLGRYIQNNPSIKIVWIGNTRLDNSATRNDITDNGIEILSSLLDGNKTFKELGIGGNVGITDKSIPYLLKLVEKSHIINIDIRETSLTQKNVIFVPLVNNILKCGYDKIDYRESSVTDNDLIKVSDSIMACEICVLKEINLPSNEITSGGASILFQSLKVKRVDLEVINFGNNKLDDNCMNDLAEFVKLSSVIMDINICSNKITDKGIEKLLDELIGSTSIKYLHVGDNKDITEKSEQSFIDVAKLSSIEMVVYLGTGLYDGTNNSISKYLAIPFESREIPLKSTTKSAAKSSSSE